VSLVQVKKQDMASLLMQLVVNMKVSGEVEKGMDMVFLSLMTEVSMMGNGRTICTMVRVPFFSQMEANMWVNLGIVK